MTLNVPPNAPDWVRALTRQIDEQIARAKVEASFLPSFTVANLPSASAWFSSHATLGYSRLIYVSNETGGAVPAFSDGTNFRRVTDRAIVS